MAEITTGGGDGEVRPDPAPPAPGGSRRAATVAKGAGLLAAGVLAGAIGVGALSGSPTLTTTNAGATSALPPGPGAGDAGEGAGGPGRPGGVDGEQHVQGTVASTTADSVTVEAADGTTTTYDVTSGTQVQRDGEDIAVTDLTAGESVVVHVLPDGSVERVQAGTQAPCAPGRGGPGEGGPGGGGPEGGRHGGPPAGPPPAGSPDDQPPGGTGTTPGSAPTS